MEPIPGTVTWVGSTALVDPMPPDTTAAIPGPVAETVAGSPNEATADVATGTAADTRGATTVPGARTGTGMIGTEAAAGLFPVATDDEPAPVLIGAPAAP